MHALKRRLAIHRRLLAFQQWSGLARKLSDPQGISVPRLNIVQLPSGRMVCLGVTASEAPAERCSPQPEALLPRADAPPLLSLKAAIAVGLRRFVRWLQRGLP